MDGQTDGRKDGGTKTSNRVVKKTGEKQNAICTWGGQKNKHKGLFGTQCFFAKLITIFMYREIVLNCGKVKSLGFSKKKKA